MGQISVRVIGKNTVCVELNEYIINYQGEGWRFKCNLAMMQFEYNIKRGKIVLASPFEIHELFDEYKAPCRQAIIEWMENYSKNYNTTPFSLDYAFKDHVFVAEGTVENKTEVIIDLFRLDKQRRWFYVNSLIRYPFHFDPEAEMLELDRPTWIHEHYQEMKTICDKALEKWIANYISTNKRKNTGTDSSAANDRNIKVARFRSQQGTCSHCGKQYECNSSIENFSDGCGEFVHEGKLF